MAYEFIELITLLLAAQALALTAFALYKIAREQKRQFEWSVRTRTQEAVTLSPDVYRTLQRLMERGSRQFMFGSSIGSDEADLRGLLNVFESISLGVNQGFYDEEVVRRSVGDLMVSAFPVLRRAIYHMRGQNTASSLYLEYERLARRWGGDSKEPQTIDLDASRES